MWRFIASCVRENVSLKGRIGKKRRRFQAAASMQKR